MGWRDAGASRPQRGWRDARVDQGTAFLRGVGSGLSFSWGDELMGVGAGASAALSGGDYQSAYDSQVERSRANLEAARRDQALAAYGGEALGSLATMFVPGGAVAQSVRGVGLAGRVGMATGLGAGIGALSGAGEGTNASERLQGAVFGGALGGALGGGTQAILGEALPAAARGMGRWWSGSTGMTASRPSSRVQMARDDLMATARQNPELGVRHEDDLVRAMNEAASRDPTLTVAEVLGTPGQGRLAALARATGSTGQMTEDFFVARAGNQGDEIASVVLGRAPASGDVLEQQLREAWRTQGPELYRPVLNQPLTPQAQQAARALEGSPLFQHRAVQEAWGRANAMISDDVALGRVGPDAASSLAHRLHYAKVALDDMLEDPTKLSPGLRNMSNASIAAARDQLLRRIERILPGYNAARSQMADIGAAKRAVEAGRQAFTRQRFATPEALARHMTKLPEAELPFFIAGVEDALGNTILAAGRDGRRNIANTLLNDGTQARMRAIYGRDAADMINRLRQISGKFEFGQRVRPSQGSITSNVIAQLSPGIAGAGLGAANTRDDPLMGAITGGAIGFGVGAAGRMAFRNTILKQMEIAAQRQRDVLGPIYLAPVGNFERNSRGLLSTAARYNRRMDYRTRLQRTRGSIYTGLGSAGIYSPSGSE